MIPTDYKKAMASTIPGRTIGAIEYRHPEGAIQKIIAFDHTGRVAVRTNHRYMGEIREHVEDIEKLIAALGGDNAE